MKKVIIALAVFVFLAYKSVTIFVMPPVEPLTKGATLVMKKNRDLGFLVSPDSVCSKQHLTSNAVCRGAVMARYSKEKENILFQLPYMQPLHWLSF